MEPSSLNLMQALLGFTEEPGWTDASTTTTEFNPAVCGNRAGNVYPDPFGLNIGNSFAGIPQNLIINIIVFSILFVIFVSLRKRRWGSSAIPLVGKRRNEWSSIFYGNRGLDQRLSQFFASPTLSPDASPNDESIDARILNVEPKPAEDPLKLSTWLRNTFFCRDEWLLERSGVAAVEYMRFQRHVIAFTAILCVVSVAIILPVNYGAAPTGSPETTFPRTTIGNVSSSGAFLWVHVAFTIVLFPMGLLVMCHYGLKFGHRKGVRKLPKTLMFYGMHPELTNEQRIRQHFSEAYPDVNVVAVNFTTDISKLIALDSELEYVSQSLTYCENTFRSGGEKVVVQEGPCGCGAPSSCCMTTVDAIEFYQSKKAELEKKILSEIQGWKKTNSVFFVTFETSEMALQVYHDHDRSRIFTSPPKSSISSMIKSREWRARFAPSPAFVSWENISINGLTWWARALTINVGLFLFLFFISTPAVALNYITLTLNTTGEQAFISSIPFMSQFLPTLLLLAVSGLIPVLIYYSVRWTGYHTKSKEQRAEMKLLFGFLLIAILIFPSLALSSLNVVLENIIQGHQLNWGCAFMPDNGAIFVNLMITTAFVGSASQLLRLGQLFVFSIRFWWCARSEAEKSLVLKTKPEFPFNQSYPDFLNMFTIIAVYSFVCPVVTPFGVLALIMRHVVDRYNMSYVYKSSTASSSVHATAVNFFLVAIIMQNFLMLFFFVVRSGGEIIAESGIILAALIINLLIYVGISWFGLLKRVSLYEEFNEDDIDTPLQSPVSTPVRKARETYVAPVLLKYDADKMSAMARSSLGSTISA